MARRQNRTDSTTEGTEPEATSTEEGTVSAETTEQTTETVEKPKAAPTDLTAFKAAVTAAVAESDSTTGDVPEASLAGVTAEYRNLDGIKAKNDAKKYVNDQMAESMNAGSLAGARAHLQISEKALVAATGGSKTEKAPADPTENFVQRVATLSLGYHLATSSVPEGVTEDWQDRVNKTVTESSDAASAYLAWVNGDEETRGDEPEVSAVVRNAVKLSQGKTAKAGTSRAGGSFTGERRDIGAHIVNAFADKEVGTFLTIAEIRNTRSDEYGDNPPSAGAISARLFPRGDNESTMVKLGIQPGENDGGKKGATKVS